MCLTEPIHLTCPGNILWAGGRVDDADWPSPGHLPLQREGVSSSRTWTKGCEIRDEIVCPPAAGDPTQKEQPDTEKTCFIYIAVLETLILFIFLSRYKNT